MRFEHSRTVRAARRTTIALTTAIMIAASDRAIAQYFEEPELDVPYVPTPPEMVRHMLDMASVTAADFVIDLGSGDGRIAIAAAKRGARALGIDIDPQRIREAEDHARRAGVQNRVQFRQQNLFEADISKATVLTMYLLTNVNLDLRPRILNELAPGTRVVSHAFDLGSWKPDAHVEIDHRQVFLWVVPAKAEGRWHLEVDGRAIDLTIEQEHQHLSGSGTEAGGRPVGIEKGWLRGTAVTLMLSDGTRLDGRVDGARMGSGPGRAKRAWTGVRQP